MVCAGDHLGRGWAGRAGRGGDAGPSGFYDLTDVMFSVRAITDSAGLLHTRLDYTPYGVAMHGLAADVNGDGSVNTADLGVVSANYNGGNELQPGDTGYDPDAFLDGSDTIVLSDYTSRYSPYVSGGSGPTFNAGWIDNPGDANGPDNSVGYDGYWFDLAGATEATSSGLYIVRHRVYDPRMGRWLERDPLNYYDGMNLYLAVQSSPLNFSDPFGESSFSSDIVLGGAGAALGVGLTVDFFGSTESRDCCTGGVTFAGGETRSCIRLEGWLGLGIGGRIRLPIVGGVDLLYRAVGVEFEDFACTGWSTCGGPPSCLVYLGFRASVGVQNEFGIGIWNYTATVRTRAVVGVKCQIVFDACAMRYVRSECFYEWDVNVSATLCWQFGMGRICRDYVADEDSGSKLISTVY